MSIQSYQADSFVDSIGINVHWSFPMYSSNAAILQQYLIDSGIRHYRDVTVGQNPTMRDILINLYNNGITANLLLYPPAGVIPNSDYWSGYGPIAPGGTMTIVDFIKTYIPPGVVTSVEMPNELDAFWYLYKWHPDDVDVLSTNPVDPTYYGSYGVSITQASYAAIRADSSLNNVKIIGPSVGFQVPSPFPDGSLYDYVDYGSFHTYPIRVNAFNTPLPYGTIINYYWNSFQASGNISTDPPYNTNPLMFTWYQPAFTSGSSVKLMSSTESGYGTESFSFTAQAKYTPRLFAEYFRNGIVSTFFYELVDASADPHLDDGNDGIIYHNLTPKPAYTALQSMIQVLNDPGDSFSPRTLDYTLSVTPVGDYTRTEYVHDLLLQKRNGDYYLLIWHEISVSSDTDLAGDPIVGVQRDIDQPYLSTIITLPTSITNASVYTYNSGWTFDLTPLTITSNQITVQATDTLSIIRLQRSNSLSEFYLDLENGGRLIKEDGTGDILLETSGDNTNGGGQIPSSGSAIVADTYIRRLLLWWN